MITMLARVSESSLTPKSLIQHLAHGPAWQTDTTCTCSSIWMVLATNGSLNLVNVQWILGHVGLEGNTEADLEAKKGTTLLQPSAPMDLNSACAAVKQHQQSMLTTGISVTHMPESIGCSLAVSISSNAGNMTGPGTSA